MMKAATEGIVGVSFGGLAVASNTWGVGDYADVFTIMAAGVSIIASFMFFINQVQKFFLRARKKKKPNKEAHEN